MDGGGVMGVFDGELYRIRSRMKHSFDGHTWVTYAQRVEEDPDEVRRVVSEWRTFGVDAVEVSHLTYATHGDTLGLSFGDYDGDEVDE
ncbi:hypothetical protein [Streptomyces sp. CAU 1734]|uniref:hypothetical protein n=1 Tax=Streptomyces sp. CAU 1734 TaxID=3140360 RepID=UPI00326024EF